MLLLQSYGFYEIRPPSAHLRVRCGNGLKPKYFLDKSTRFMLIQDFENSNEQNPFMVKIEKNTFEVSVRCVHNMRWPKIEVELLQQQKPVFFF